MRSIAAALVFAAWSIGAPTLRGQSARNGSSAPSCFRARSALVYASAPGNHPTGIGSGTRVTFRRGRRGWTGVSADPRAQEQRPTMLQDLLIDAVRGRVYYLVQRGSRDPLVVQGRIDCDSLWGTVRPRYSKQEPTPIVFRRVRPGR